MQRRPLFILSSCLWLAGFAATVAKADALQQQAGRMFDALPLIFEENIGQTEPQYQFLSHADGHTLLVSSTS